MTRRIPHIPVFVTAMKLGLKQIRTEKIALIGNFIVFAVLMISYAAIFRCIPAADMVARNITFAQMLWYFAATEFILFCSSFAYYKELQAEIQSDLIHLALLRPCPVWVVKIGEWSGHFVGRFLSLCLPIYALAYYLTDQTPLPLGAALGVALSLPLAGIIMLSFSFIFGCACLWLGQSEPAYWIWQKSLFVLGALIWPLSFYPPVMQGLVWLTPFPAILAASGEWTLDQAPMVYAIKYFIQIAWLVALLFATSAVNRAALRRIQWSGQ